MQPNALTESLDVRCCAAKVKCWCYIIRRAAALPGGHRQCAGGYVATGACPDTEATRRCIC